MSVSNLALLRKIPTAFSRATASAETCAVGQAPMGGQEYIQKLG